MPATLEGCVELRPLRGYRFSIHPASPIRVMVLSTGGSNFDTVLQIRHFNDTQSIMGCNDDYGSGLTSKITLSGLVKGVNLLIIIEGYYGDYGDYARLNIIKN